MQLFDNGDRCAHGPRTSEVELQCAETALLVSAVEKQTCKYSVIVAHPLACNNPEFKVFNPLDHADHPNVNSLDQVETWNIVSSKVKNVGAKLQ